MNDSKDDVDSSRRALLAAGASAVGLGLFASGASACADARAPERSTDALDEAYERIAARFPDAKVHTSNHAPMVAEVLCTLGHGERVAGWLDANLQAHEPWTGTPTRIEPDAWRAALGDPARLADWRAFFENELAESPWRDVLARWLPRLVPGLAGAATHGVIRTAHVARALGVRATPSRLRELACGLAYWAATYQALPWDRSKAPEVNVAAALAKLETRRPKREPPSGNLVAGLASLSDTPSFAGVAGRIEPSDALATLAQMSSAFARLYLRNPDRRIAFVHSITAPSALRLLAPYLDADGLRLGVRYAWQAAAGLYVVYGDPNAALPPERTPLAKDELVARAVAGGGTHGIKGTEASLRERAYTGDDALLLVAEDAVAAGL
ncbi:MAG: questin oxidase family protein [Planctomycetes bacterium]|nr:questin oxidase family protein [Planctomycetota bacterium]